MDDVSGKRKGEYREELGEIHGMHQDWRKTMGRETLNEVRVPCTAYNGRRTIIGDN